MNKNLIGVIVAVVAVVIIGIAVWPKNQTKTSDQNDPQVENSIAVATNESSESSQVEIEEGVPMSDKKNLIIYFSRADENYSVGVVDRGNTAMLADVIASQVDSDVFEIEPVEKYPAEYQAATEVAKAEQEAGARPAYIGDIDISGYETIFLGYPIWWGDLPMTVYTFLENHDFAGKTVYLFNTHEGSGNSGTYQTVAQLLTGANVDTNGLAVYGHTARTKEGATAVRDWLTGLGF